MRAPVVVLVCLGVFLSTARAERKLEIDAEELRTVCDTIFLERTEEPVGLDVPVRVPKLGLEAGDIVVTFNGRPALHQAVWEAGGALYLDVLRHKKYVFVRVHVRAAPQQIIMKREDFKETLGWLRQNPGDLVQVKNAGSPSGVIGLQDLPGFLDLDEGDIVRAVGASRIRTATDLIAAFEAHQQHASLELELETLGQRYKLTVTLTDPAPKSPHDALLDQIRDDEGVYLVPASVRDAVLNDPRAFNKAVKLTPYRPHYEHKGYKGYKVYGVQGSALAALGLDNGDLISSVNGVFLENQAALEKVLDQLRTASHVKIELQRAGKPQIQTYRIY